jgi:N-acetylmuramoyl-L-alanine amidase
MTEQMPAEEYANNTDEPIIEELIKPDPDRPSKKRKPSIYDFWSGLTTVLAAAFLVATLFTIWTPGSVVDSSLEARMAQVFESGPLAGELLPEAVADSDAQVQWENIGIVAGHYGFDSGAVCPNGVTEAELNLEIATLVQKMLTDQGYEVDLLQEFDQRLWGYQAAVVVSIHLDSCQYINEQATGYKVAAALSARDAAESQRLTQCLSTRYGEITGLPYHAGSVTDDMTYYHAFNETDPRTMAAIIEAGFMNLDYRLITEETDLVAEGIVAGILCYLNNEPLLLQQNP